MVANIALTFQLLPAVNVDIRSEAERFKCATIMVFEFENEIPQIRIKIDVFFNKNQRIRGL